MNYRVASLLTMPKFNKDYPCRGFVPFCMCDVCVFVTSSIIQEDKIQNFYILISIIKRRAKYPNKSVCTDFFAANLLYK